MRAVMLTFNCSAKLPCNAGLSLLGRREKSLYSATHGSQDALAKRLHRAAAALADLAAVAHDPVKAALQQLLERLEAGGEAPTVMLLRDAWRAWPTSSQSISACRAAAGRLQRRERLRVVALGRTYPTLETYTPNPTLETQPSAVHSTAGSQGVTWGLV